MSLLIAMLGLFAFSTNASAQSTPKMDGLTFTSSEGETLDFYSNSVIYHAQGADISRKGEYSFGGTNTAHGVGNRTWYITVNIYVGSRTVTLKGTVKATDGGQVMKLILNGKEWTR